MKAVDDIRLGARVAHERHAKERGDRLFGEVVARGTEPAGRDDEVGRAERRGERLAQALRVVADARLAVERHAEFGELAGDMREVGVDDVSEQKLGADAHDGSGSELHSDSSKSGGGTF